MLDDNEKAEIKRIKMIVEEDHKMIKKLYTSMQWSRIFRILYILIIIGLMFGSYYFVQPYLENFVTIYSGFSGGVQKINDFKENISLPFGEDQPIGEEKAEAI